MKRAGLLILLNVMALSAETDDGPGRGVARISVLNGDVSVKRGDSGELIAAAINAPLVVQDRLYTGSGSRAEIQFDWANMIRLAANAEVRLADLENRRYQIQVARGTVTFRVLRDSEADVEISTPSVSVRPVKRGEYRVTVLDDGTSEITVRSGEAEIFTPRGAERLRSGKTMVARGSASDPEFQVVSAIPEDDWDRWNERRDRDLERSRSYQYVNRDVYGADDLDGYGDWVHADPYGYVWAPRVAPGWAPYRYGRWSWVDWYGWTWVSYDPWGWAPYHYGRWFYHRSRWCWYPGPIHARTFWRPALVAFFGFGRVGVGVGFGNVGWVPLAPYEPYYPWYGRRYYSGYRNRNYIDNSVHITNNINIRNVYRNSRIDNAVTAVNGADFSRGRTGNAIRVAHNDIERASLVRGQVPLTPDRESLRLANRELRTADAPRSGNDDRRFYSRRQPTQVDRVSFEDQRRGVEQIARQTLRGEERTADSQRPDRGTEGGGIQPDRTATERTADENSNRGWRRVGEPVRGDTPSGQESLRRSEDTQRGWRRFGDPARTDLTSRGVERGEAGATANTEPRFSERRETGREADTNWRRFGSPGRESGSADQSGSIRGGSRGEESGRSSGSGGWRRLGEGGSRESEPAGTDRGRSMEGSRRDQSDSGRESRSEPIRISPPIVREREAPRSDSGIGRMSDGIGRRGREDSAPSRIFGGGNRGDGGGMRSEPRGGGGGGGRMSGGDGGRVSGGDGGGSRGGGGGGSRGEGRSGGRGR